MRGYAFWCMGWDENDPSPGPPGNNGGCMVLFMCLVGLFALSCFRVAFETGNMMGVLLGLAVIAGLLKGLNRSITHPLKRVGL